MSDVRDSVEAPQADPRPRVGLRSILLGVFILWELFYLPAANLIKLRPVRLPPHRGELDDDVQLRADESSAGPGQAVRDGLAWVLSRWGELTGQTQGWSLFAPTFGRQASLPVVTFDPGPLGPQLGMIRSEFAPANPDLFFRMPWPSCRLYNYEYRLALLYWSWDEDSYWRRRDEWDEALRQRVRWQNRSMLAYLRWRRDQFVRANPNLPAPTAVVLSAELIPSPPPSDPYQIRKWIRRFLIARWLPNSPPPPGRLPVQAFDLIQGQYGPPPFRHRAWVWLPEEED
jgi:hypothetical protein